MTYEVLFPLGRFTIDMNPGVVDVKLVLPTGVLTHRFTGEDAKKLMDSFSANVQKALRRLYVSMKSRNTHKHPQERL